MKSFSTRTNKKWFSLLALCAVLSFFSHTANAQCYGCYNYTGNYSGYNVIGYNVAGLTPTCSAQSFTAMPSTGNIYWYPTAGVTYNFTLAGSGWAGNDITVYYYNGTYWYPYQNSTNGSMSITPSSASLSAGATYMYLQCTSGTGCCPAWNGNSATLTYQIAPPYTPSLSQNPATGTHVCTGNGVTYTAGGSGVGSFAYFQYEWNGTGGYSGSWLSTTSPATWGSCCPGNTLWVIATTNNGGCLANSTAVTAPIDATSSTGSWVYPTLYYCGSGATYTAAGSNVYQGITSYTATSLAWEYGLNCGGLSGVGGTSSTSPWNCCFPGNPNSVTVFATNGVCPQVSSCFTYTADGMSPPTGASISPAGPVCAPTSGNITLTYTGGSGGNISGANLRWYTSCPSSSTSSSYIASGQSAVIAAPSSTTTYYCAWVDPCGYPTTCASATFTVVQNPGLSSASYSICQGSTTTLTPSSGGTWASNNTGVATVSGNTVTGVAGGSTTFNFTTSASPGCTYTIGTAVAVTNKPTVSINSPLTFCTNQTTTLSPSSGGTWVSNNTAAATVVSTTGAVTGAATGGSANFTFTSSTAPNCANTTASSVVVTPLPTIYGVTGGGTYCLGSSSAVGLSGSQTGVNYQLYVNNGSTNVATGSPVAGTGSAISFGGQTTLGTYTVVATTVTNSCTQNMSGSVVVTELSPNVTNSPGATGIGTNGATLNGTD